MKTSILLGAAILGLSTLSLTSCASTKNTSAPVIQKEVVEKLELGEVTVYDFGKIKLYAYKTNDALGDECYVVKNAKNIVVLESSAFKAQVAEFANYVKGLNKTVAGTIMAYHPNGYNEYEGKIPFATSTALKSWGPNGGINALTTNFVKCFGNIVAVNWVFIGRIYGFA